jgi:hypothetical protein
MLRAVPPAPLALERRRGRRGQQLGGSVRVVVARGAHASLRAEMLCAARMVVSVATRAVEAAAVGGHDATPVPASPLPAGLSQHSLPNHLAVREPSFSRAFARPQRLASESRTAANRPARPPFVAGCSHEAMAASTHPE